MTLDGCTDEDWDYEFAWDVNNDGWIVASGLKTDQSGDPMQHLFVLRPYEEPACPADFTGPSGIPDGVVDVNDLVGVINQWGICELECTADIDRNCVVDVTDLVAVNTNWGPCPGSSSSAMASGSMLQTLVAAGLSPVDLVLFLTNIQNENYRCWMAHYLTSCNPCLGHSCSGPDPYTPQVH